jgi:replicative DNA helicase
MRDTLQPPVSANGRQTESLSSGVPGLDNVMAGGFPQNHLFLVEGDPGTGKTTLALQFLLEGLRPGERDSISPCPKVRRSSSEWSSRTAGRSRESRSSS